MRSRARGVTPRRAAGRRPPTTPSSSTGADPRRSSARAGGTSRVEHPTRLYALDWLRPFVILLLVSFHAAIVYTPNGGS